MSPKSEVEPHISSLKIRPVKKPNQSYQSGKEWMEAKKKEDGAEGLWRIHDNLYDFTEFVKIHPGGSGWLKMTEGTDITEAFEAHHISKVPEGMLPKFHIRPAKTKRNSPFTFNDDGFYRTLKERVRNILKTLPQQPVKTSAFFTDSTFLAMVTFAILAVTYQNYFLALVAGSLLALTTIASHNYIHKKDNRRMYYFSLSGMDYREMRVTHALSHHLYTNTVVDLEITNFERLFQLFPKNKSFFVRYGSWIYCPILWALICHISLTFQIMNLVKTKFKNATFEDFIPFSLPIVMLIFGRQPILSTLLFWNIVLSACSFHYFCVGFNAAHHHPDIFHDGDTPRPEEKIDWGIAQLDAVVDRFEITGSHWLVLTNFGDHALHHMFPTLDHGTLEHIYPIFEEVMKQFNLSLRFASQLNLIKGQFRQLSRVDPNPNPPDLFKKIE